MKELSYYKFTETIAQDNSIDINIKVKTYFDQFKIKDGKRKINSSFYSVIVDKNGDEFPYMISNTTRNEAKLIEFDYIYVVREKQLSEVLGECGLSLKTENCYIDEGNGWRSRGTRYFYKDIYCEQ